MIMSYYQQFLLQSDFIINEMKAIESKIIIPLYESLNVNYVYH